MHPSASARKRRGVIRDNLAVSRNNPQKRGSIRAPTAAEAGSYGSHLIPLLNARSPRGIPTRPLDQASCEIPVQSNRVRDPRPVEPRARSPSDRTPCKIPVRSNLVRDLAMCCSLRPGRTKSRISVGRQQASRPTPVWSPAGCRFARPSASQRGGRSGPPCRWPARAGSRARGRELPSWKRRSRTTT